MGKILVFVCLIFIYSCSDNSSSNDPFAKYPLRIKSVIPNPIGADDYKESFTIINKSTVVCSQADWYISDKDNTTWSLNSLLPLNAGVSIVLVSDKTAKLQNNGDTLYLHAPDGVIIQTIKFGKVEDGDIISTEF